MKYILPGISALPFLPSIWTFRAAGNEITLKSFLLNVLAWFLLLIAFDIRTWILGKFSESKFHPYQTSKATVENH